MLTKLLMLVIQFVLSQPFMSIFQIETNAANDICLNDLHYKISREIPNNNLSNNIVLINSGDMSIDSFRLQFAQLIDYIDFFKPKVIGVDHDFSNNSDILGTTELVTSISSKNNIVLGLDEESNYDKIKISNATYGSVNFFEHFHTVRRYNSDTNTFAAKIAVKHSSNSAYLNKNKSFVINFVAQDFKLLKMNENDIYNFKFSEESNYKIPSFNSKEILQSNNFKLLQETFQNKIILVGHLGNNKLNDIRNDLEDKYAVPCDTNLLFRQKTMPGVVIHANAIENIINPKKSFNALSDEFWFIFIEELFIIAYLSFLLIYSVGKLINILVMLLFTIPLLFIVLYVMQFSFYIEVGTTLLQLLIFEEMVEILEPLYNKLKYKFKNKKILD